MNSKYRNKALNDANTGWRQENQRQRDKIVNLTQEVKDLKEDLDYENKKYLRLARVFRKLKAKNRELKKYVKDSCFTAMTIYPDSSRGEENGL